MTEKKWLLWLLSALCILLMAGCRSDENGAWRTTLPEGQTLCKGVGNTGFSIPVDTETFTEVSKWDAMQDVKASYKLNARNNIAYVQRQGILYSECILQGDYREMTAETVQNIEDVSKIRIIQAGVVLDEYDSYRKMQKKIYSVNVQGLFSETYYGDYTGYLSIITKDNEAVILFACAKNRSSALYESCRTHWYREYELNAPNSGLTGSESDFIQTDREIVGFGEYAACRAYYRGPESVEQVDFAVRLIGMKYTDKVEGTSLPELKDDNKSYLVAQFEIDSRGYDISKTPPALRIRSITEDEKEEAVYLLPQKSPEKIQAVTVVKGNELPKFVVGTDKTVIDASKKADMTAYSSRKEKGNA